MKTTLLSLTVSLLLLPALAQAKVTAFCGFDGIPNDQTVRASDGEVMAVLADGNPTTGFQWISMDDIQGQFEYEGQRSGSAGVFTFKKKLATADHGRVFTFVYKRPWESVPPAAICRVKAAVR